MAIGKVRYFIDKRSNTVFKGINSIVKHFVISVNTVYKLIQENKIIPITEEDFKSYEKANYKIIHHIYKKVPSQEAVKNQFPSCNYIDYVGIFHNRAVTTVNVIAKLYKVESKNILHYIRQNIVNKNKMSQDFIRARYEYGATIGNRISYFVTIDGVKYLTSRMTCFQSPSAQAITDSLLSDLLVQQKDLSVSFNKNVKNSSVVEPSVQNTYANTSNTEDDFDDLEKCALFDNTDVKNVTEEVVENKNADVKNVSSNIEIINLTSAVQELTKQITLLTSRIAMLENKTDKDVKNEAEPVQKFAVSDCISWTQLSKKINAKSIGLNRNSMLVALKEAKLITDDNQPCNEWGNKKNWFVSSFKKIMGHEYTQTLITPYGVKGISKKLEELTNKRLKNK